MPASCAVVIAPAAYSLPAKGVGGDYYDTIKLDDDKIAFIITDVAGKGIPASLVMVMIKTIFHLIASTNRDAKTLLSWLNHGLSKRMKMKAENYATASVLIYNQKTGVAHYSNAVHHPVIIYRAKDDKFIKIDTEGLPLGIAPGSDYQQKKLKMEKDDFMVFYTDGIIEARNKNNDEYKLKSLIDILKDAKDLSSQNMLITIIDDLNKFTQNVSQHDDLTLMIAKICKQ